MNLIAIRWIAGSSLVTPAMAMCRRRANQNALTKHCGRRQRADRKAFPVAQGRPQKIVEKTLLRSVERQKAGDHGGRYHLGGTAGAVVALEREPEPLLGQGEAKPPLPPGLDRERPPPKSQPFGLS